MDELHQYFRDLSEGKLDIEKTVEYQFIQALKGMNTPIGLNEFAKELNLTSIIIKLLRLMTSAGLITQSEYGLDTSLTGDLTQPSIESSSAPQPLSKPSTDTPSITQPPSVRSTPSSPRNTPPTIPTTPSFTSSVPSVPKVPPVPSVPSSTSPKSDADDDSFDEELPPHMQERLNFERMRTGSKKLTLEEAGEGLEDLFDELGSLEDELKDDDWD